MLEALTKDLRAAHLTTPAKKYLIDIIVQTAACALLFAVLIFLIEYLNIQIPYIASIPTWALAVFFVGIIPVGTFLFSYFYPKMIAAGRKSKIDLDLPYAVTYMQALSTTVTLYDIFKGVFESRDLYGEVSKECGLIVRDVEVFGFDLITAIENAKEITPSENFRELLNDLLLVHRSGGDLKAFFQAKSDSYREISKNEMDSLLQFLEMIAEIYVTAFVAGPIAIIIMLVAQNLSGQNTLGNFMPLLFIGLPLGAMALIAILYILLPPNNLAITRRKIKDTEFLGDIICKTDEMRDDKFEKHILWKKRILRLKDILRHPMRFFISNYAVAGVLGFLLAVLVCILWGTEFLPQLFPESSLLILICLLIIASILPLSIAYEIRNRYVVGVEKQLPEFLREISDMRDIGMTLQSAIHMIAGHKTGVLSSEIHVVSEELKYGSSLSGALVRMEERIGLTTVKRAISLLVRASQVTDHIREILSIAVTDMEHYLKMKSKRFNVSFVYLAVIYLSFAIYLFAAYEMNVAFISSFSSFNVSFDISGNKQDMFIIGIILAFFSGIMAGQMSANTMLSGLKHSIIMLVMTIITFVYLI